MSSFFCHRFGKHKGCLTKRAPDVWDSAAFSSIFLASSFSCSQTESTPAHTQVTQTVRQPKSKNKTIFETQVLFCRWVWKIKFSFFYRRYFFKFAFWVLVFIQQVFKFSAFSLNKFSFRQQIFEVGFVESLKSASRFLVCVLVSISFDWLCFAASIFVVGLFV